MSIPPPQFPKDRLSLCMIVRNEEDKLARCLTSVAPWVGEMVVVDTGSTDGTVAIAESFGARVVHFPWVDDFSAARNAALDAATGDWALILDADEVWIVTAPEELARAVQQDTYAGFSFPCYNHLGNGGVAVERLFRLFRRTLPGMRYRGQVHEQVSAVADRQVQTAVLDGVRITHDGHTPEVMASRNKIERNLTLAKKLVESRPEDPFAWFCLGLGYDAVDRHQGVEALEKTVGLAARQQLTQETYLVKAYVMLIQWYGALGRRARALDAADRAVATFSTSPDLRYLRGHLKLSGEDFAGAAEDFEVALGPEAARFFTVTAPGTTGYASRTGLGLAWLNSGRNVDAEAALRQAVSESPPGFVEPHRPLGLMLLQRGAWAEALPLLHAAWGRNPEDRDLRFNLGWCLYKLERYEEANEVLEPIADTPDVQHLLGKVHLEWGRGDRALELLSACKLPPAGLALGWCHYVTGQSTKAAGVWEEWLRAGAADWGTKDTLAKFLFLLEGGRRPSGQPERPAEPLRDMDHWFRLLLRYQRFDDVERAVKRGPELGERLWTPLRKLWGITLVKEGFYDVGLHLLLEAQRAEPEDAEVYYWLGYSSLHQQQVDDARVLWQTCLELVPGHALATQGLSLLR